MDDQLKSILITITATVGAFLLAIGAVLVFTDVKLPLGIALMAAGAISLITAVALNWSSTGDKVADSLNIIVGIISGALIAIGAILAISGANLPLGIALIAAGAITLIGNLALNWDTMPDSVKNKLSIIMGIAGAAMLALGVILCITSAGIPLGIALIAAGVGSLVSVFAVNKDAIVGTIKNVMSTITDVFSRAWEKIKHGAAMVWWGIKTGVLSAVNFVIKVINTMVKGVLTPFNVIIGGLNKIPGVNIPKLSFAIPTIELPPMPRLAKGAAIPANKEFMAVLGDQRHGYNLEGPESMFRGIVRDEIDRNSRETLYTLRQIRDWLESANLNITMYANEREIAKSAERGKASLGHKVARSGI